MMLMTEAPTDLLAAPDVSCAELEWEEFDRIRSLPAGAWTAVAVDVDPGSLPTNALPAYLEACARVQAWAAARLACGVAELAARPDADSVDATVALALRESIGSAQRRIWWASRLRRRLPRFLAAFSVGDLSEWQAISLVEATSRVDDADLLDEVQTRALAHLGRKTARELSRYVTRLLARLDPAGAQRRAREARDDADVTLHPRDEGMACVVIDAPVEDGLVIKAAADAYAANAKSNGDPRKIGVLRAELLRRLCDGYLAGDLATFGAAPRAGGRPIEVAVTVDLQTALGRRDLPGEVPGMGIVTRDVIARLIHDEQAKLRLMVIDEDSGRLLYRPSSTYRPTPEQIAHVRATYVHSAGLGSQVLATRTDTDHAVPWPGGETVVGNLIPLDRTSHRAKTLGSLSVTVDDAGTVTWNTVTGQTRTVTPYDYRLSSASPSSR